MDISEILIDSIKNCKPISFAKFGDGEYNCIFYPYGRNCDRDKYTNKLSTSLLESFKFLSKKENSYIGKWGNDECIKNFNKLTDKEIKYADYHSFIISDLKNENKIKIYKEIKNSKMKKIIVCNYLLEKSQLLLNTDHIVYIPLNNWFDTEFDKVMETLTKLIDKDEPHIVMTCCGMGAKVVIAELAKKFNNGLYFDLGSAIDFLCTKKDSRGWKKFYDYNYLTTIFKDLLDDSWNDDKYNNIYSKANQLLGVHL